MTSNFVSSAGYWTKSPDAGSSDQFSGQLDRMLDEMAGMAGVAGVGPGGGAGWGLGACVFGPDAASAGILQAHGYRLARRFWQMRIDLAGYPQAEPDRKSVV